MKFRRHHNNKGQLQVRRGQTRTQVRRMAEKLRIPYEPESDFHPNGCYTDAEQLPAAAEQPTNPTKAQKT
jgi:hypothetical protein